MKLLCALVILCCFAHVGFAQDVVGRALVNGQKVLLLSDNTWKYEEEEGAAGCQAIHAKVEFCGSRSTWQKSTETNPDATAAYRHDDRNYAQFIVESLGTRDGLTAEALRNIVLQNAAAASGQAVEDVVVIGVFDSAMGEQAGETVVYQVNVDGLNVVFANTLLVLEDLTVQAMTYSIGADYSEQQQALNAQFLADIRINVP